MRVSAIRFSGKEREGNRKVGTSKITEALTSSQADFLYYKKGTKSSLS